MAAQQQQMMAQQMMQQQSQQSQQQIKLHKPQNNRLRNHNLLLNNRLQRFLPQVNPQQNQPLHPSGKQGLKYIMLLL
jgi:hypothetical protein